MYDLIVSEAITTGIRSHKDGYFRELILLYTDGTWEKMFKSDVNCNLTCMDISHLKGLNRDQVIAKLEKLYYTGKLEGKFMDYD